MTNIVLAIDPGRIKCGVAVVGRASCGEYCSKAKRNTFLTIHSGVVPTEEIERTITELIERYNPTVIIIGNGTGSSQTIRIAESVASIPVKAVDEQFTTLAARKRFFIDNPPKGLRRLIPTSLQTPSRPYDDYVAVILAESYLLSEG